VTTNQHNPAVNALNMTDQITRKVKLLLLGDSGVGKSSLILRWTMDTFNASLISTFGVNFKSKRVHVNGEAIQAQVWDTAGQEQFHKITTSYYRGANAIILVFDVSDGLTFNNVEYWMKSIKAHASDSVHVVLVGNKTDLRSSSSSTCITYDKGKEVADRFSVPYFETSAKDSMNVDLAFMTPVRTIIEAESRASSLSHDSEGKKLVEKTLKGGILQKLMKENPLTSSKTASSGSENSNPGNSAGAANSHPDEKEKCLIS
jgi:small GTP-binding protein